MSYFDKILKNVHFFKSGKIAVLDVKGNVVASNSENLQYNIKKINSPNTLYSQWKKIDFDNNPNGIIEYNINGTDKIGYYSRISNTDWVVLSGVVWAEFKVPLNENIRNIIIVLLFIILIAVAAYIFVINYFSKPLFKLLESIEKINQGNYSDRFIYDKDNEFGEVAKAFNNLIDKIEKDKKDIESKNRDLQSLTSNIPGGVHRNIIENGEYLLDFLSIGCLKLLGYSNDEFNEMFGKKIFDVIYEKDRKRVEKEIKEQTSRYNKFNVEYRIKRKDGSIIWVIDNGQIVKGEDGTLFSYSVVINITDAKIARENLRISEERYRIVMSQTDDVIFQWDIAKDTLSFSGNWRKITNDVLITNNISQRIHQTNKIYKDDLEELNEFLNKIINGEKYKETEIRIINKNNDYIWCKIRATAMFDQNGNLFRVIGIIADINTYKIHAENLLFKAQTDSLTGLYNKGTTQSMVEEYMEKEKSSAKGALFIIDVDNFKAINDTLGHLTGDSVLMAISSMLSEVFNENSILGRIGGDEFIVFLKDIASEEFLYKKAEDLLRGFRTNTAYKISSSVGIAKYPEYGESFKELFANADKALYLAKNRGKDSYCIFTLNNRS